MKKCDAQVGNIVAVKDILYIYKEPTSEILLPVGTKLILYAIDVPSTMSRTGRVKMHARGEIVVNGSRETCSLYYDHIQKISQGCGCTLKNPHCEIGNIFYAHYVQALCEHNIAPHLSPLVQSCLTNYFNHIINS